MTKADKMRLENEQAFKAIMDGIVRLRFPDADWESYVARRFGPDLLRQSFSAPSNPLTIGNPHHNDELDPENNP